MYDISQFKPIRREITLEEPTKEASKPYITSLAINNDASFALVADSSFRLSAIHIPSGSIVCSKDIPFLPQAVTFSDGMFYIGGSDRVKTDGSTQFSLMRCNVMCEQTGSAPVSATGVYAMAVSSTGSIAAAGYSASKFAKESFAEDVDVYWIPPVRSFSISV